MKNNVSYNEIVKEPNQTIFGLIGFFGNFRNL